MADYEGKGFLNIYKPKQGQQLNPNSPKLKGFITWKGERINLAAWTAKDRETKKPLVDKNGNQYFNIRAEKPQERGEGPAY